MIFRSLLQGLLGSFGWMVPVAAGLVLAWKLVKDAKKPVVVVAVLGLAALAGWWFWPHKAASPFFTNPFSSSPSSQSTPLPVRPVPRRAGTPMTYPELHAPALKALAVVREIKAKADPSYLDPKIRNERHQARMAKEIARRGSRYLVTAEDRKAIEAHVEKQYVTQEQRIDRAQADMARLRQKYGQPTLIGGLDHERRGR